MPVFAEGILPDFSPGSPEMFISLSLLMLLGIGSFKGDAYTRSLTYLSMIVLLMAALMVLSSGTGSDIFFNGAYVRNSFITFCKITILLTVSVILFMNIRPMEREEMARFEYPVLVLLSTLGMIMTVSSNDLIGMYLALELQSFSLYILVVLKRDRLIGAEGGIKYFILGALASAFILYGSSFLYGVTGTTEFPGLFMVVRGSASLSSSALTAFILGILLILAGVAFKLALAPFHMWSPDVYEGSSTPLTALIATAPKIAAFALLVRFFIYMPGHSGEIWEQAFVFLSLLSIALGAFAALFQSNIKRVLSYSAISHMGYALFGLLGKTQEGVESVLVYLVLYVIMTVGCFACLLNLRKDGKAVENISDLSGLSRDNPVVAGMLAILLFSLAGIPPLAGFFAKLGIFSVVLKAGYYKLALFGMSASVLSAAYYLKIVKIMYFEDSLSIDVSIRFDRPVYRETYVVMSATALITLSYVFYPSLLVNAARMAAVALFNPGLL